MNKHSLRFCVRQFYTPPELAGQMIEYSYGYDGSCQVIVERCEDRSDRSVTYRAYDDPDPDADFDPWNGAPDLGDDLGPCIVVDD